MEENIIRYEFSVDSVSWDENEEAIGKILFAVNRSKILGVVGPSGCGKSTLLNAFAGRDQRINSHCTRKKILDNGSNISLLVDDCVFMPQDSQDGLLPWYNVKKYLRVLGANNKNLSNDYLLELISKVGLESKVLSTRPSNLSGGQRRRVLLLATLLTQCEVVFLDEPFVGLDLDVREKAIDLLRSAISFDCNEAYKCGAAIVVSHSIEDVAMLCDNVAIAKVNDDNSLVFDFYKLDPLDEDCKIEQILKREKLIRERLENKKSKYSGGGGV